MGVALVKDLPASVDPHVVLHCQLVSLSGKCTTSFLLAQGTTFPD
jgi:hypothetical protein